MTKEEEYVHVYLLTPSPTKPAFRTISFKTVAVTSSSEHSDCIRLEIRDRPSNLRSESC